METNETKHEEFYNDLKTFKDNNMSVHIEKKNGRWYNGLILELTKGLVIIDDEKLGALPIDFDSILWLDKREKKR